MSRLAASRAGGGRNCTYEPGRLLLHGGQAMNVACFVHLQREALLTFHDSPPPNSQVGRGPTPKQCPFLVLASRRLGLVQNKVHRKVQAKYLRRLKASPTTADLPPQRRRRHPPDRWSSHVRPTECTAVVPHEDALPSQPVPRMPPSVPGRCPRKIPSELAARANSDYCHRLTMRQTATPKRIKASENQPPFLRTDPWSLSVMSQSGSCPERIICRAT